MGYERSRSSFIEKPNAENTANSSTLASAQEVIKMFQCSFSNYDLNLQPILQYSKLQISLACQLLQNLVEKLTRSNDIINDIVLDFKNLVGLQKRLQRTNQEIDADLQNYIDSYITILETAFQAMNLKTVNWYEIQKHILSSTSSSNKGYLRENNFDIYIPKIRNFEISSILGQGGFAIVYLVTHLPSKLQCCLKVVSKAHLDRNGTGPHSYVEKLISASTSSPNLVKALACFSTPEAYVILMELFGTNIQIVLNHETALPPTCLKYIMAQVISGVFHLHYRGFVHCDIKPSNLLIDRRGHIKIADFEISKICKGHHLKKILSNYFRRTADSEIHNLDFCGTIDYAAPEFDKFIFGRASDFWSVGVTAYKILTGHVPIRSRIFEKLQIAIWSLKKEIPDYPAEGNFVELLLVEDPALRLGSRSYNEVEKHQLFETLQLHYAWQQINAIPDEFREPLKIIFESGATSDNTFANSCSSQQESTQCTANYVRFECLKDSLEHLPLCTFISNKFFELIDTLVKNNWQPDPRCNKIVKQVTPQSDPIDYNWTICSQPGVLKDIHSPTAPAQFNQLSNLQRSLLAQSKPRTSPPTEASRNEDKTLVLTIYRTKKLLIWSDGFDTDFAYSKQNQRFIIVTKLKTQRLAHKAGLIEGDLIVAANGKSIIEYDKIPWRNDHVELKLCLNNPFRSLKRDSDFLRLVSSNPLKLLQLHPLVCERKKGVYGILTKEICVWNKELKTYFRAHIVVYVDSDLRAALDDKERIYYGDAVIKVNETDLSCLEQNDAYEYLNPPKNKALPATFAILESSPLRNK